MDNFQILEKIFEPIVIVDSKEKIIFYNNYFATFLKRSPRQLKAVDKISEILDFEGYNITDLLNEAKKSNSECVSPELKLIVSESDPYTVVAKMIPEGNDHFIICLNDVSVETHLHEKYRIQLEELRSSHEQLLQTDKLATLGQLTTGISHEINNPLTVALGASQNIDFFLDSKKASLEDIKESNDLIVSSLSQINEIIINMKSYVHKAEEKKEYCDLSELIESSLSLVQTGWAKNNIKFVVETPEEPKICLVNKIELGQVIVNLLQNAVDSLEEFAVKTPRIKVWLENNKKRNRMELFVEDNGPGIPNDIREDIFKPFYTTKKVGKGTGLGLAISEKLVSKLGGSLKIEKSDSEGTIFILSLPMLEDSSITHNSKLIDNLSNDSVKSVLVVDNEPNILNIMEKFIQEAGHLFIGSSSGEEALRLLDEMDVDIVITDYFMPKMNGAQFAEKLRKNDSELPILFLSGSETLTKFQEEKKRLNISGLIVKPFTKEEVFSCINFALEGKEKDGSK